MKKSLIIILQSVVVLIFLSSCNKDDTFDNLDDKKLISFKKENRIGVYEGYEARHLFSAELEQVTFTDDYKLYFMSNTEQTEYIKIDLSSNPFENQDIVVEVACEGLTAISSGAYNVKVVRSENQSIWLWNEEKMIGFRLTY